MIEQDEATRLRMALIDQIGGTDVEQMGDMYYRRGLTLGRIARKFGIAKSTVHKRIARMRGVLITYALLPTGWKHAPDRTRY